jgi:glucan phosphoethanolaminetransferase (alkaline phosphatase superfamily)
MDIVEKLINFAKDYWVLLVVILILVFVIGAFIRAMFKFALIAAFIAIIAIFVFGYTPKQVGDVGKEVLTVAASALEKVLPNVKEELKKASYTYNADGSYTIKTASAQIVGKKGDPKGTLTVKGKSYSVNIDQLGDQVKKNIAEQKK